MIEDGATLGVEEEFLLVDPQTRRTVSRAPAVLARADGPQEPTPGGLHGELLDTQVEAVTGVCADLETLRCQLAEGRRRLASAARDEGARLVSTGTAVLGGPLPSVAAGERFARSAAMYAGVLADYQVCGCHVHVGVADRDTAVAVVDHLRPWLPTLLALSVNSPFDRGRDSGYASWRMLDQARFPGAGVPPRFGSAHAYDRQVARLVEAGVLVDGAMSFWLARPSPWLPTVEIRAADAAATVEEAVLQAALSRALVRAALADLRVGREAPPAGDQICAAAVWSAARYGVGGPAVHPVEERRMPAARLLEELLTRARPALEEIGDLDLARTALDRIARRGTGADRQRRAAVRGLPAVVDMLAGQTLGEERHENEPNG